MYVAVLYAVVGSNVRQTINGEWTFALCTIEGEEPAVTATQAVSYSEVAIVLHFQCCILGVLSKIAFLQARSKYTYLNLIENAKKKLRSGDALH